MSEVAVKKVKAELTSEERFDAQFDAGLPCKIARLHAVLMAQGFPPDATLSSIKIPGLQMSWTPVGLLIKAPTKAHGFKRITVPSANVINCDH